MRNEKNGASLGALDFSDEGGHKQEAFVSLGGDFVILGGSSDDPQQGRPNFSPIGGSEGAGEFIPVGAPDPPGADDIGACDLEKGQSEAGSLDLQSIARDQQADPGFSNAKVGDNSAVSPDKEREGSTPIDNKTGEGSSQGNEDRHPDDSVVGESHGKPNESDAIGTSESALDPKPQVEFRDVDQKRDKIGDKESKVAGVADEAPALKTEGITVSEGSASGDATHVDATHVNATKHDGGIDVDAQRPMIDEETLGAGLKDPYTEVLQSMCADVQKRLEQHDEKNILSKYSAVIAEIVLLMADKLTVAKVEHRAERLNQLVKEILNNCVKESVLQVAVGSDLEKKLGLGALIDQGAIELRVDQDLGDKDFKISWSGGEVQSLESEQMQSIKALLTDYLASLDRSVGEGKSGKAGRR